MGKMIMTALFSLIEHYVRKLQGDPAESINIKHINSKEKQKKERKKKKKTETWSRLHIYGSVIIKQGQEKSAGGG